MKRKNYVSFFFIDDEDSTLQLGGSGGATTSFESIKHVDEDGNEFWYARELQKALGYTEFNKFVPVIEKAMDACKKSQNNVSDHLAHVSEMLTVGNGAQREFPSYKLSRYACYLIVMNGDPRKEIIAEGQTYFAVQTRKQELAENFDNLTEDQKRLETRNDLKKHNKSLADAVHHAGIDTPHDYATFQNHGYKGLYNGLTAQDIHTNKGLKKNQKILDHMSSVELAANLFRATQAEDLILKNNVQGKDTANAVHYDVGQEVRETIKRLGGTMPEDLPTPDTSIKQLESKNKKLPKQ